MGVGGVGIFNWCLRYYFIVFIVAARSMRKFMEMTLSSFNFLIVRLIVLTVIPHSSYNSCRVFEMMIPPVFSMSE